jgi:hypothetical protein
VLVPLQVKFAFSAYVPSAMDITSPGFATSIARVIVRSGAEAVPGLASSPLGETNLFAIGTGAGTRVGAGTGVAAGAGSAPGAILKAAT